MKKLFLCLSLVLMMTVVFASSVFAESTYGVLSGKVYDSDGKIVEGAQVKIVGYGGPLTSKYGNYEFATPIPVGTYTITCKYLDVVISQSITIHSGDNVLNFGAPFDTEAPVTTGVLHVTSGDPSRTSLQLTLNVADPGGTRWIKYRVNGTSIWNKYNFVDTITIQLKADKMHTIEFYSADMYGHEENTISYINFDTGESNCLNLLTLDIAPVVSPAPDKAYWWFEQQASGSWLRVFK
jgi:hypothetical protein